MANLNLTNKSILLLLCGFFLSCGVNLYDGIATKESQKYYEDEAKVRLDEGDYQGALDALSKVERNSPKVLIYRVAVILGQAGLSFWQILLDVVDDLNSSNNTNNNDSGIEKVFSLLSDSVFGAGEERESKLEALTSSISLLEQSSSTKLESFRCFLTGILVLPSVEDGTNSILEINSALNNLASAVEGAGETADQCPGLSEFESALSSMSEVQQSLNLVLAQTSNCPILNFLQNDGSLNEVEQRLTKFTEGADRGCPELACDNALCQSLQLGCVQNLLTTSSAVAGDGIIDRCELVYNCLTPGTCF